jgi:hypothetical protein
MNESWSSNNNWWIPSFEWKLEDDDEWISPDMNECSTFMNDIYLGMES